MRIEKVAILNEVTARVKDSDYCFILNYGGVESDEVQAMLTGPTAIVTGKGEVTAVAKDVMDFVNGSDGRASVKGADYDGKIVDAAMVEALSKVPGKDQLRATLLMLLKEPATRLARVLSEKAKKEGGEAPAA